MTFVFEVKNKNKKKKNPADNLHLFSEVDDPVRKYGADKEIRSPS